MSQAHWAHLLSTTRFYIDESGVIHSKSYANTNQVRSDFHVDYDRVVFSGAFRKLGRKTQVHPFAKSDHTHNRLTHSVEVASVGRSLGNEVGVQMQAANLLPIGILPSDIGTVVQVACLAHDLGNPPFGHTGEEALRAWWQTPSHQRYLDGLTDAQISDVTTYEGNAHSLRIVSHLEMYVKAGGMRLTAASLGTLMKYPWTSHSPLTQGKGKFNIYQSELALIRQVAHALHLPIITNTQDSWARHPLSYLMEAADDICYALLDLEDAVELGLIEMAELEHILSKLIDIDSLKNIHHDEQRRGALRGKAIAAAISEVTRQFMRHHDALLQGSFEYKDLLSACHSPVYDTLNNAKQLAFDKVFHHPSKLHTEIATFGCLGSLLDLLIPAVHAKLTGTHLSKQHELSLKILPHHQQLDDTQQLYDAYMMVLDFVGGLTDNSAAKLARDLSGVGMV